MNNAGRLIGARIDAVDGDVGSVHDLYFDEHTWSIRYLVVDTGKWLQGRQVLVAPDAIVKPWHHQAAVAVKLTMEQIRSSPEIDTTMPISRVSEALLHQHYQWNPYWDATVTPESQVDASLRSANDLGGDQVNARDGEVGQVEDLLLDDDVSRILFLVVKVKTFLFGKRVLVGPSLISGVDWATSTVQVNANRQALKSAQEYNPAA